MAPVDFAIEQAIAIAGVGQAFVTIGGAQRGRQRQQCQQESECTATTTTGASGHRRGLRWQSWWGVMGVRRSARRVVGCAGSYGAQLPMDAAPPSRQVPRWHDPRSRTADTARSPSRPEGRMRGQKKAPGLGQGRETAFCELVTHARMRAIFALAKSCGLDGRDLAKLLTLVALMRTASPGGCTKKAPGWGWE